MQCFILDRSGMRPGLYYPDSSKRVCMFSSPRAPTGMYQTRTVVIPVQSSIEELATQQLQRNEMDGIIPSQSNTSLDSRQNVGVAGVVDD